MLPGGVRREEAIAPVTSLPQAFPASKSGIGSRVRGSFCGCRREDTRSSDSSKPNAHIGIAKTGFVGKQVLGSGVAVEVQRRGQGLFRDVVAKRFHRRTPFTLGLEIL